MLKKVRTHQILKLSAKTVLTQIAPMRRIKLRSTFRKKSAQLEEETSRDYQIEGINQEKNVSSSTTLTNKRSSTV